MDIEEKNKVIEKGKRMLREYLNNEGRDTLSTKNKRQLFKVIENKYRECMNEESYFANIEQFVNRRKPASEKEAFCKEMVTKLVQECKVRETYAELYPNEYQLPTA